MTTHTAARQTMTTTMTRTAAALAAFLVGLLSVALLGHAVPLL